MSLASHVIASSTGGELSSGEDGVTHERWRDDEPTGGAPEDWTLPFASDIPVTEGPGLPDADVVDDDLVVAPVQHGPYGERHGSRAPGHRGHVGG